MRVDLLITELEPGGAERCCTALASHLHGRGHGVRVLSLGPRPTATQAGLVRQLDAQGIRMEFLGASTIWDFLRARSRLRQLALVDPPEVVQAFLWHANILAASVYPALGIPVSGGVRVVEPRRWRAWLAPYWSRRTRQIVCVSDEVAAWCQNVEGIDPERLFVIPNGFDPGRLQPPPADPRVRSSDRILLFVGRLEPQKGIDGLMEHADKILERLPDHRLVVIGEGSLRTAWQAFQKRSPFSDRIDLLGRRDDVLAWMLHAELLIHPARYEGMPNVVLEAMACGLAIVAFPVEGMRRLLGEKAEQQMAPLGDWEAWGDRVVSLARDPTQRHALAEANRRRAFQDFRLIDSMNRYEESLQALSRGVRD